MPPAQEGRAVIQPVKIESRIAFGISYFATEAEAEEYAAEVEKQRRTYNGGFFHGMPCGRAKQFDHEGLFAVTD
jgi:hypothetical protein